MKDRLSNEFPDVRADESGFPAVARSQISTVTRGFL